MTTLQKMPTHLLPRTASRDPDRRALRRAARVAVTVVAVIVVLNQIPFLAPGAMMGSFAALGLLTFSDFGGPRQRRFLAYLSATLAGLPLMLIGLHAAAQVWTAVLTMAVVAMVIGVLAVLRGMIGVAQRTLLLVTVLSLTAPDTSAIPAYLGCWFVGGLAAAVAAVTLWPVFPQRTTRAQVAAVLRAIAEVCRLRWVVHETGEPLRRATEDLHSALVVLHERYDGNLLRPAGVTSSDRALAELVDEVTRLEYMQEWRDVQSDPDPELSEIMAHVAVVITDALHRCAGRLVGEESGPLSVPELMSVSSENVDAVAGWLQDRRGHTDPGYLRTQVEDTFPLRITRMITARIAAQTIQVQRCDGDRELSDADPASGIFVPPGPTAWERLRAHTAWKSPWFRNSLRSAVALSLSVAVARLIPADHHPFWVVLGTLSALRFDALGTGRTARQALIGTTVGVIVSAAAILLIGDRSAVWWALLPITLFVAAYTPGVVSFMWSQSAFTLAVIVLFSLAAPANIQTAADRLLDVALGLVISLIVSLLIWPRGVIESLAARLREAMLAAGDFYVASVDWMAHGAINDRLLAEFRVASYHKTDRAREALDLSIAQRPPDSFTVDVWTAMTNTVSHVNFAALAIPQINQTVAVRGDQSAIPPQLMGPILVSTNEVRAHLADVTVTLSRLRPDLEGADPFRAAGSRVGATQKVRDLRDEIDAYLRTPSDWTGAGPDLRPVIATWLTGWNSMLDWTATVIHKTAHRQLDRDGADRDQPK